MTLKLWHCKNARSFRPLWAMEEMGLEYELEVLPFPPRVHRKEFFEVNLLGTIPFFRDGETEMTESTAICHYLVDHYAPDFGLGKDHPEYGSYLNWLYQSDATFTFPQTLMLRYGQFASEETALPQVVEDYRAWYLGRLRWLDAHLETKEWLVADRFTIADIAVGYALKLGEMVKVTEDYTPQTYAYLQRLKERDGFQRALAAESA